MVRNAGGRAFDAIRTLAVLQTIGSPGTIVVMHHTGKSLEGSFLILFIIDTSRLWYDSFPWFGDQEGTCRTCPRGEVVDWGCQVWRNHWLVSFLYSHQIYKSDIWHLNSIEDSVREDLALIKASPLIKKTTQVIGLKYDIHTGILTQVEENKSEL